MFPSHSSINALMLRSSIKMTGGGEHSLECLVCISTVCPLRRRVLLRTC